MKKYISHSLSDTTHIAHEWLKSVSKFSSSQTHFQAALFGLSGHLGAGKTAFVKCVAKELGITEEITSPTFVIMKAYPIVHPLWKKLIHIDAYRLEKAGELKAIGFDTLASDPTNLILVEWPEQVNLSITYPQTQTISFELKDDVREIGIDVQ